jgi:hypothetical protein
MIGSHFDVWDVEVNGMDVGILRVAHCGLESLDGPPTLRSIVRWETHATSVYKGPSARTAVLMGRAMGLRSGETGEYRKFDPGFPLSRSRTDLAEVGRMMNVKAKVLPEMAKQNTGWDWTRSYQWVGQCRPPSHPTPHAGCSDSSD